MTEWQPIETAPKEGPFLVYFSSGLDGPGMGVCICGYDGSFHPLGVGGYECEFDLEKPTHWMSLPESPK